MLDISRYAYVYDMITLATFLSLWESIFCRQVHLTGAPSSLLLVWMLVLIVNNLDSSMWNKHDIVKNNDK